MSQNPHTVENTADGKRAVMLAGYIDAYEDEFGERPLLMPLDDDGKAPIARGRFAITDDDGEITDRALSEAVDADEAVRRIRDDGARGFALYAGREAFGTGDVVFVDHDDDDFPTPTASPTFEVMSGSGQGRHETYRNDPDDPVANARVGDNLGEIRAETWYVVTPGSVHPSGGIYHVVEWRPIATLADADLTDDHRPSTARRTAPENRTLSVTDMDGDGELPDDDDRRDRLEVAFGNRHDGERIRRVYNGNYAAAGFDDRSGAEFWLANRIDSFVGLGDKRVVASVLDDGNLQKWGERHDRSYRDSVLTGVGTQDWYYNPLDGDGDGDDDAEREDRDDDTGDAREATGSAPRGDGGVDVRQPSGEANAPQHPVYSVLGDDDGDVDLHLIPETGTEVAVEVRQNGRRVYTATKDRGFWSNSTIRGRIAADVVDVVTGVGQEELRQGVKDALNQAALDAQGDDFEESLRTDLVRELRRRTTEIIAYPTEADEMEFKVTLAAGANDPIAGEQTLSFMVADLNNQNPIALSNAYLNAFVRRIDPDSAEWKELKDYWVENADIQEREADIRTERAVEEFADHVNTATVWDSDSASAFDWGSWNGYHVPDFRGSGDDAVLFPGMKVAKWKAKDFDDLPLSRALRERGILLSEPRQITVDGTRRMVWPVSADDIPAVQQDAMHSATGGEGDGDDDDAPAGLR